MELPIFHYEVEAKTLASSMVVLITCSCLLPTVCVVHIIDNNIWEMRFFEDINIQYLAIIYVNLSDNTSNNITKVPLWNNQCSSQKPHRQA